MSAPKHRYDIDLCRAAACIMAIALHVPDICSAASLSPGVSALRSCFILLSRAVNPIFYMVTGCLYLGKDTADIPKTLRKAGKLLALFLVWSALYIIRSQFLFKTYHSFNEFYNALFTGHYHLWFLTALASAYFFLPLLHGAIHGKKVSIKYIILLFIALGIVKYNAESLVPGIWRGPLTMFSSDVLPVLVYMPYGWWLSKQDIRGKHVLLLGLATAVIIPLTLFLTTNYASVFPDLMAAAILPPSLMCFCSASFVFVLCRYIADKSKFPGKLVVSLAGVSLGVYLIHPMIIDEIARLEYIGVLPALFTDKLQFLRYPFILAVTAVLSYALSLLIKKIPFIKKLILQ